MRVCFFHAAPEWSGRARAFADAAAALEARGHEVRFACARGGEVGRLLTAAGREVIGLDTGGAWPRVGWRLREVLHRHFVDVVFVHGERDQLHAAAAARFAGRGAVVRRVPALARLTSGRDARLALRLAACGYLFALDDDLRAAAPPRRALAPAVAPPGIVAGAAPSGDGPAPGTRVIACLCDTPGHPRVVAALRTVAMLSARHPELRLRLIGPAADDRLRILCAALGTGAVVEFVNDAPRRAAAGAMLADAEFGWVLGDGDDAVFGFLDCFAAGVPVLAERNPLSARFIGNGEAGVLTVGADPPAQAALLATLLASPGRCARMSAAARAAAARWPIDATAAGFEQAAAFASERTRWR